MSQATVFMEYMEEYCEKEKNQTSKNSQFEVMSDYISAAKDASTNLTSRKPLSAVMIPLLVRYFKEKESDLFIVMEATTTLENVFVEAQSTSLCPLLIVRGSSIFDESASCCVVIRGEFIINVNDITDGFLVLILSYFDFNIAYPKAIGQTLEFMQRFLLKVNPEEGVRHESKAKRKRIVTPAVSKLSCRIQEFEARRSLWSLPEQIS